MRYKVLFTANLEKKLPIQSGYRPNWISDDKPNYNCGILTFDSATGIHPGEWCYCILEPLCPDLWENVMAKDVLRCMEGLKQVGEAEVIEVIL